MWSLCFVLSACLLVAVPVLGLRFFPKVGNRDVRVLGVFTAGTFLAAFSLFVPFRFTQADSLFQAVLMCMLDTAQVFGIEADFSLVEYAASFCPRSLVWLAKLWGAVLFVLAPILSAGFVLSIFMDLYDSVCYLLAWGRNVYVFSELDQCSLALARDVKRTMGGADGRKVAIVFTNVHKKNENISPELLTQAQKLGAICLRKDITAAPIRRHGKGSDIFFLAMGPNETQNLDQTLCLIQQYHSRENTHVYVFATKVESELVLAATPKGQVKVRRINHVRSLINWWLYQEGGSLFESAAPAEGGDRDISAVILGMGNYGTEMVKALSWYCQMDGYRIRINAFDLDDRAQDRFTALAPELMDSAYNGVHIEGEAGYDICIHSGVDVFTHTFAQRLKALKNVTYVAVAMGSDDENIRAAVAVRMLCEQMGCHPVIHAVVYDTRQKQALQGICNYRNQSYRIDFIGDLETIYSTAVILDSQLERIALSRHTKYGQAQTFWAYEYNYRSSIAAAIHMKARCLVGIPGADKREEELTDRERETIQQLEHKRWNAYMRSEGYIYSGSTDETSRNDLGKMHNDLVEFSSLSEEEKRKDSRVGTI